MASSFYGVKTMAALVVSDRFSNALIRCAYRAGTTASQRVVSNAAAEGGTTTKKKEEEEKSKEKAAWVPDPVTGCYCPENYVDEIDPVDLRAKLLKPRRNITN